MSHPLPWAQATYFENRVCSGFRVSPCGRWPCFRITSISPIFHSIDINSAFQFRRGLYSSIQEAGCGSKGRCGTQEAHPWCGKGWGKEWAQETGQGQTSWQLGRPGRLTVFLGSRPLHIPFVSIILNSVLCDFVCFLDQIQVSPHCQSVWIGVRFAFWSGNITMSQTELRSLLNPWPAYWPQSWNFGWGSSEKRISCLQGLAASFGNGASKGKAGHSFQF